MTVAAISTGKDGPKLHVSEKKDMTFKVDGDVCHLQGAEVSRSGEWLSGVVPFLIVDDTGLRGRYDFDIDFLQYRELANQPAPNGQIDLSPAVNKALQPLGLKLELKRRAVEVFVIDHAEKTPAEN